MKSQGGGQRQGLEGQFDATFATTLALREKQIQQSYRPIIGIHKWFARRPGSIFRSLLLAEFNGAEPLASSYWRTHKFKGTIADPFMGGGTPIFEANRLGFHVIGTDINPMAFWVVRQSINELDRSAFAAAAAEVIADVDLQVGRLYQTECRGCGATVPVKYFLWVKRARCPECEGENDLFPGYLLAEAVRHPLHVVACSRCGALNEFATQPTAQTPGRCTACDAPVHVEGCVRRQRMTCRHCEATVAFAPGLDTPPRHRLWALEYHCPACKPSHTGRFFKTPDDVDLVRSDEAARRLATAAGLPIPQDEIPAGDETDRLHRWGYRRYCDMFNERQLLGLGTLMGRIQQVPDVAVRHALLTVFSDVLRYQNMLCRYDTYALKCQDIFSVHGFPVGLVQCENNVLGIPRIGSGSFRHFVAKYLRAKDYCAQPFETDVRGGRKRLVPILGERIGAAFVTTFPRGKHPQAWLSATDAKALQLPRRSLDGVFTDPPYFDNVQYAELMDFCFAWLRPALASDIPEFRTLTTRSAAELTGNLTLNRGLEHFTEGLSDVFRAYTSALKPRAPFVFTYHHNDPEAYVPVIVAILDAGLQCTATLPAAAEMGASLHIARTSSSILDSVFVCRRPTRRVRNGGQARLPLVSSRVLSEALADDAERMTAAGIRTTAGDLRCLAAGHLARFAVSVLGPSWDHRNPLDKRMDRVRLVVDQLTRQLQPGRLIADMTTPVRPQHAAAV